MRLASTLMTNDKMAVKSKHYAWIRIRRGWLFAEFGLYPAAYYSIHAYIPVYLVVSFLTPIFKPLPFSFSSHHHLPPPRRVLSLFQVDSTCESPQLALASMSKLLTNVPHSWRHSDASWVTPAFQLAPS